jgi:hypothetical protein
MNVKLQFFNDINEHVTYNQASKQAYDDVVSPKTRASNLPDTKDKPNKKKFTNKNRHLYGGSPSIARDIKKYTQTIKEIKMLKMEMTRDIIKQILKNEQAKHVGKCFWKDSCKWLYFYC